MVIVKNEKDEFLLVQEAKRSCYGKWYLPAGRVHAGEDLFKGAVREVEEEAGLIVEPTGVFKIENMAGRNFQWIRFLMRGKVVGGKLKTTDEADSESLQAQFFSIKEIDDMAKNWKIRAPDLHGCIRESMKQEGEIDFMETIEKESNL